MSVQSEIYWQKTRNSMFHEIMLGTPYRVMFQKEHPVGHKRPRHQGIYGHGFMFIIKLSYFELALAIVLAGTKTSLM